MRVRGNGGTTSSAQRPLDAGALSLGPSGGGGSGEAWPKNNHTSITACGKPAG